MEKIEYISLIIKTVEFDAEDVITTSGEPVRGPDDTPFLPGNYGGNG